MAKENKTIENEKCPEHNVIGKFIPPTTVNEECRKLIVTFECPNGHNFTKEFDLK
jgi:hypothetical protein